MRVRGAVAGTAVFAVAFVVLGLPDFAHGVAWPDMRRDLDRALADLGLFLVVHNAAYLASAASTGRTAGRWGVDGLVARATVVSAIGLAIVATAPAWPVVLGGAVLMGVGSGGMDAGFNAAAALRDDGRLMGLLHAGYGVGAAIGPLVVGASLAADAGWRPPYAIFALASLLLLGLLRRGGIGGTVEHEPMGSPRGVLLPCLAFLVYVGLEIAAGQWAFTYLTGERGLGELAASTWVSVYWVGLTAGRLWLGLRGHTRRPERVLLGSGALAVGATLVLWLGGPASPLGLPLLGLALSTVFPLLMLLTPRRVGPERAAAAIGWQAAVSGIGGAALPAGTGIVLDVVGIGAYGPVILVFALALVGVLRLVASPP